MANPVTGAVGTAILEHRLALRPKVPWHAEADAKHADVPLGLAIWAAVHLFAAILTLEAGKAFTSAVDWRAVVAVDKCAILSAGQHVDVTSRECALI